MLTPLAVALTATLAAGEVCEVPQALDKYRFLRRLSLDLRSRLPTVEEYESLDTKPDVPREKVKAYLTGEPFRAAMRGYHERLFWPNLANVTLEGVNARLVALPDEPAISLVGTGRRRVFRALADVSTSLGRQCGDYEQTHFLPGGRFQPDPAFVHTELVNGTEVRQEGWRLVEPYWAPGTQVKVCAYDAQETPAVTLEGRAVGCQELAANGRSECGCGPKLRFCYSPDGAVPRQILTSAREQLGRSVDEVTVGGRPYSDLILSTRAHVNGPLAAWRKYLAPNLTYSRVYGPPELGETPLDKPFADASWTQVERGPHHAGVLTLAAYLLRFQTGRARANRFRIDFECEYFTPSEALTREPGCEDQGTDLTRRCSCQYCHRALEPLAAHWGDFAEVGTTYLRGDPAFPSPNPACVNSSNPFCSRFYVTAPDADHPGRLLSQQYADDAHPEQRDALAGGPRRLAEKVLAEGTFDRCAVKRAFQYFVKREMHTRGEQSEEAALLQSLAKGFRENGRSFPWLVEQVVWLPQYRRTR